MNSSASCEKSDSLNSIFLQILKNLYVECISERCQQQGSNIKVNKPSHITSWIVFQFQSQQCKQKVLKYGKSHDCYIYVQKSNQNREQILIVELKSKRKLKKGLEQLQNGLFLLENTIKDHLQINRCLLIVQLILGCKGSREVSIMKKKITFEKLTFFDRPIVINLIQANINNAIEINLL